VDEALNLEPGRVISEALSEQFGDENVIHDYYVPRGTSFDFPVLQGGRVVSSIDASAVLKNIPVASIDSVLVHPEIRNSASEWLRVNRDTILTEGAS
jgi:hypothetical protein